ncbi:MAG: methyltransferase domain-containing protein [Gammaproteobacteria bacterium]|nr:methyltransferase domain-containing protein [Gammaproteobacteria bacterium]
MELEQALIQQRVRGFHGDTLLWLGPVSEATHATSRCMVKTRIFGHCEPRRAAGGLATIATRTHCLPLPTNSVDGVVLHHVLEESEDPRRAIREVTRVIRPGGRLLICGFNPWSLWSARKTWAMLRRQRFRNLQAISPLRLHDWLAVLGFVRTGPVRYLNYRSTFPLQLEHPRWRQFSNWLNRVQAPLGGVYMILATKEEYSRVHGTPQRVEGHDIAPLTIPKPTARHFLD